MSVNNKRVFYVKYLAHDIYTEIMKGRPDVRLDRREKGGHFVPVPKFVIQQIVGYYSRSARYPSGVDLDEPFTLPARIREIQVERGQAIVVQ